MTAFEWAVIAMIVVVMLVLWWSLPVPEQRICAGDWLEDEHGHAGCSAKVDGSDWFGAFRPNGSKDWFMVSGGYPVRRLADHVSEELSRRFDLHRAEARASYLAQETTR